MKIKKITTKAHVYSNIKNHKYLWGTLDLQVTVSPGSCWSFWFGWASASWGGFAFPRWTRCGGICPHHTLKSWEEKNRASRERHELREAQVGVLLLSFSTTGAHHPPSKGFNSHQNLHLTIELPPLTLMAS